MSHPDQSPKEPPKEPRRARFQFGLGTLMLATVLASFLAATLAGLVRPSAGSRATAIILGIAAPMGVMIVYSLLKELERRWRK